MNVLQKNKHYNISEILLLLILISLPLGFAVNSIAIALLFIYAIYKCVINKRLFFLNKTFLSFTGFYFLCIFSLLWTDNIPNTKTGLVRFLPYLVLPVAFALFPEKEFNRKKILNLFSKILVFFAIYCISLGLIKAINNSDISYLFYHKLSGNLSNLNAIYFSVFTSLGISFFITKKDKTKADVTSLIFLSFFLVLLSSKIIITLTTITSMFFLLKKRNFRKLNFKKTLLTLAVLSLLMLASSNFLNRVKVEFEKTKVNEVLNKKEFGHSYLWTGTGLRAFQIKAFVETLKEQKKVLLGLGLNNSQSTLNNKYKEYNLYRGYLNYNYHNQYIQIFAELGVVGLFLFLFIFGFIIRRAIIYKDYFLFSFIILILVVCLTESFLWRQRGMVFFITLTLLLCRRKEIDI